VLEGVRATLPAAKILLVCDQAAAPLLEHSPLIDQIIRYDSQQAADDVLYIDRIIQTIAAFGADACISTAYSRRPLTDVLALGSGAPVRITFAGDLRHISAAQAKVYNNQYTYLAPDPSPIRQPLNDLRHLFDQIGISCGELGPRLWTSALDTNIAENFLRRHHLEDGKMIVVHGGAERLAQSYLHYPLALAALCKEKGLRLVILNGAADIDWGAQVVRVDSAVTLPVGAEILRRAALVVGDESHWTQVACAVGRPHVVVLGGGQFGRHAPCSPLTSVVCLPLQCYGCNWQCRYPRAYCVQDVAAQVVETAARQTLAATSAKPRIFVQDRATWKTPPGGPDWAWFHSWVQRREIDLIVVSSASARPLNLPTRHGCQTPSPHVAPLTIQRRNAALAALQAAPQNWSPQFTSEFSGLLALQGLRETPAAQDELPLLDEILCHVDDSFNHRVAAMLYFLAHELSLPVALDQWPQGTHVAYLQWLLALPQMLSEIGEAATYGRWLETQLLELEKQLTPETRGVVASAMNLIQAYFSPGDLLGLAKVRARIIEGTLVDMGHTLDHRFAPRQRGRKIRLGILMNHFSCHTETYATIPAFEHLDRKRFEIRLYVLANNASPIEQWCKEHADKFTLLPGDIGPAVTALRKDDLDVLFIGMNIVAVTHPVTLLAAHRLARVQMTSICSPISTGFKSMDYFATGLENRSLKEVQAGYSERIAVLEEPGMCLRFLHRPAPSSDKPILPPRARVPGTTVYMSGANFFKIIPELRRTWVTILAQKPESVLVLYPFSPSWSNAYSSDTLVQDMQALCRRQGLDPERVIFLAPMSSAADVPELLRQADVYLDSFPYSGALSANDALEARLPIVAMDGRCQRFAQATQILRSVGLDEMIVPDEAAYIRLAVELGNDVDRRDFLRDQIERKLQKNPRVFDSRWYARQMEATLQRVVDQFDAAKATRIPPSPVRGRPGSTIK
jgi:ADP-heptose:LPS heptosyltransferase